MVRVPRMVSYGLVLIAIGLGVTLLSRVAAQTTQRCFTETSFCVAGPFRLLWERGGLAIFGFPLSPQGRPAEPSGDPAAPAQLQWFERHRFEFHPANPAPYSLLLGRVGAERLAQLGRDWSQVPPAAPRAGCAFFAETGRNLCSPFLEVWRASGVELDGLAGVSAAESLALFGLPLTEASPEEIEGQTYLVQWFERARFELHEDGGVTRVIFGRLGAELLAAGGAGGVVPDETPIELPASPTALGPAPQQPTVAQATATRAPQRPTATRGPAEPSSTSVRPSATAEPEPSNTPRPTNTSVPPTNTPRPTSTPTPDPFKDPPATPPPGFAPGLGGTLPSAGTGTSGSVPELDAETNSHAIGAPICLNAGTLPEGSAEVTYTISGPDGAESVREQVTIVTESGFLSGNWRWAPGSDYSDGTYIITAAAADLTGSIVYSATGSIRLTVPELGSVRRLTTVRVGERIDGADIGGCSDGSFGSPGDQFAVHLTGFEARETVELHLYTSTAYKGLLETLTLDDQGKGSYLITTDDEYLVGSYIVVTQEQAIEEGRNPGYLRGAPSGWEQRLNLR